MPHGAIVVLFTMEKMITLCTVVVLFATIKRKEDDNRIVVFLFATGKKKDDKQLLPTLLQDNTRRQ